MTSALLEPDTFLEPLRLKDRLVGPRLGIRWSTDFREVPSTRKTSLTMPKVYNDEWQKIQAK